MGEGASRVILKSPSEIDLMREAGRHTQEILDLMCQAAVVGATTWDLDYVARAEIKKRNIKSAFLGYRGYPGVVCCSVNEEIVHGIPKRNKKLKNGDIIGIDFGTVVNGYVGDTARTVVVGQATDEAQHLVAATEEALSAGIAACQPGHRLSDIGKAIQGVAERHRLAIVRDFVGHGIGTRMHEDPQVPNYYDGPKPRLRPGLVLAIEPMLNVGGPHVKVLADGWTAVTRDNSLSAHFEHTVAITEDGHEILTLKAKKVLASPIGAC